MKSFVLIGFLGGGKGYAYFVLFVPSMSWYWMNNKVHTENNNKQQKKSCKHFFLLYPCYASLNVFSVLPLQRVCLI